MNRLPLFLVTLLAAGTVRAAAPDAIVMEDFEKVAVGAIPAGFTKTGAIGVAEGVAHSGTHALKIEPALRGGRFVTLPADVVAKLAGEHWGRLYYKVQLPAPSPAPQEGKKNSNIHTTFVAAKCTSPLANDPIEVRLAGLSLTPAGEFRYLYNVQPKAPRKEFGARAEVTHKFEDTWTLLEWHADAATQTFELYVNGADKPEVSVHKGAGNFEGAEIPTEFQTYSIGWTNYQPATGEGFTVWIDDIAVGKSRIGPTK